jgi:hypothetical protein
VGQFAGFRHFYHHGGTENTENVNNTISKTLIGVDSAGKIQGTETLPKFQQQLLKEEIS